MYIVANNIEQVEIRFCSECGFIACECGDTADMAEYEVDQIIGLENE